MSSSAIISVVVLALLVFWSVGAYNRLIRLKNGIASSFGQVDVQLKRRYDLVPDLVEAAQKHLQHERDVLEAVNTARNQARIAGDAMRSRPANAQAVRALAGAEAGLDSSLARLFAIVEAYPELKADPALSALGEDLAATEQKLAFARQAYNDSVRDFNQAQAQFPAMLVARLFGLLPAAMLRTPESPGQN